MIEVGEMRVSINVVGEAAVGGARLGEETEEADGGRDL